MPEASLDAGPLTTPALPAFAAKDGIKMFMSELLTQEQLQEIVLQKLAAKVELDGPAFDKWLEVPAVV